MKTRCAGWMIVTAVLTLSTRSGAQNLVPNGDFGAGPSGWTLPGAFPIPPNLASFTWDDDSGSPAPGALRILISDVDQNGGVGGNARSACIDVSIGTLPLPWDFGGRRLMLSQVGLFCAPLISVASFSAPGCTGFGQAGGGAPTLGATVAGVLDGAPVSFTRIAGTLVADPMPGTFPTASVRLEIGAFTGNVGEGCEAIFDDVYFGGDGTTPVELLDVAVE